MHDTNEFIARFRDLVGRSPSRNIPLSGYSSFRVGGPADFFFEARTADELSAAFRAAAGSNLPCFVIGGGYNLLFDDEGYRGLILKNAVRGLRRTGRTVLRAMSGTTLKELIDYCLAAGLGELEFLAGIPGTVGGAVFGNAGAFGDDIGGHVIHAFLLGESGETVRKTRRDLAFEYRHSALKLKPALLLGVSLRIGEGDPSVIGECVEALLKQREVRHPPRGSACAGSYFKNPTRPDGSRIPAARLLDRIGAKGLRSGGAAVYEKHANFIINTGRATAHDILDLAAQMKAGVLERFGIELDEEVIFLPADAAAPRGGSDRGSRRPD